MLFKASAPGSLMLLGEYAVLLGKSALVCAVNKRMSVMIEPRLDNKLIISSTLGNLEIELRECHPSALGKFEEIKVTQPFQFVIATLNFFRKQLPSGCHISITSEFSDKIGFGSSAAVTVSLIKALSAWLDLSLTDLNIIRDARSIIRKVQGLGSGADVAACVLGGVIAYKAQALQAEKLPYVFPITAIYSGYKTPTVEAVTKVNELAAQHPKVIKSLFQTIGLCAEQGIQAVRTQDWQSLGKIMNLQQDLMRALGVSTPLLNDMLICLHEKNILGAKISGSGLGDCIVALGLVNDFIFPDNKVKLIPIEISAQGVMDEKI